MNVDLPSDAAAKLTSMSSKQGVLGRPTTSKKNSTTGTISKVPSKTYYDARHQPFPDAVVTIHSFEDTIEVLSSLQRPKKIVIRGSDGQLYPFLCKSQDDLRVDSRCLDFCHLFNKCMKKNSETRRRQLNIRTYAVYPINERCGLIEWLPNLCTFRSLVTKFYRQRSSNFSEVSNREIKVYGNSKDKSKEARYNVRFDCEFFCFLNNGNRSFLGFFEIIGISSTTCLSSVFLRCLSRSESLVHKSNEFRSFDCCHVNDWLYHGLRRSTL